MYLVEKMTRVAQNAEKDTPEGQKAEFGLLVRPSFDDRLNGKLPSGYTEVTRGNGGYSAVVNQRDFGSRVRVRSTST